MSSSNHSIPIAQSSNYHKSLNISPSPNIRPPVYNPTILTNAQEIPNIDPLPNLSPSVLAHGLIFGLQRGLPTTY
jgi:hypothetical protein